MNIPEFISHMKTQFSRATGFQFAENLSEAEILAAMENVPSFAEQSASFETKLNELSTQFGDLNTQFGELKSKLDVIEQTPKFTMDEVSAKITEAVKLNSDQLKSAFGAEINSLKKLSETVKETPGEVVAATIESTVAQTKEPVQKKVKLFGQERTVQA